MTEFPLLAQLRLAGAPPPREKLRRRRPLFLRGPVPLEWLQRAARLPGQSLAVGIVIWFLAGLNKAGTVRVTGQWVSSFGIDRHALYRALKWLEADGLVGVRRRAGSCPEVRLIGRNLREGNGWAE